MCSYQLGVFDSGFKWAHCDVTDPPKCDNYISVPEGVPISIVEEMPVLPGGYVYYQCDDPEMTTSLGMQAPVSQVKSN